MRLRDVVKLFGRFGQSNVEDRLTQTGSFHKELQGKRRFTRTGNAFDQVKPVRRKTARKDIVKSFDARAESFYGSRGLFLRAWHYIPSFIVIQSNHIK